MYLIPFPKKLEQRNGSFPITRSVTILLDSSCEYADFEAARLLQKEIERITGTCPDITKGSTGLRRPTGPAAGLIVLIRESAASDAAAKAEKGPKLMRAAGKESGSRGTQPSYRLTVSENLIILTGSSGTGLLYGVQTLRQLVRNSASIIPCIDMEDRPDFEIRGFYHDIARGKVPSLETLKELADRLSFYKINQLQLYIEHSFAFKSQSEIWADSDPITAEDILVLDEYCRKLGIELVPSISTFGHLYHTLVSKTFRHLNEYEKIPDVPFTWVERMQHYTLDASNPQSFDFVSEMIDEFLPLFSSDKFNICCDETNDLGCGRNKALADEIGKGKLYLYFVKKLIKHVKSRNKAVMMWGDILLKYPEVMNELPDDVILLNWGYSPDVTEDSTKTITEAGLMQVACPGVQGWNKLVNQMDIANRNISAMVAHARKYNARGILNTDWGDFGHINLFANSMPGMIFGAGLSWNSERTNGPTDEEISLLEYGDRSGRLIGLLRDLSRQTLLDWETTVLWYYSTIGYDVEAYGYRNYYLNSMLSAEEARIKSAHARIMELQLEIAALNAAVYPERKQDVKEFLVSAEGLALFQALLLVIKKKFLGQKAAGLIHEPQELAVKLEYWFSDYKKVWRDRNRESELYRIKDVILGICRLLRE